jgi:four helix bundle protein
MLDSGWDEMSYRNLEVWQLVRVLVVEIHQMTLHKLPKSETFEEGSQIRRSIKSVKSTIVEGYGRRRYKQELIRFLIYALASCDETTDHLEMLVRHMPDDGSDEFLGGKILRKAIPYHHQ